VAELDRPIDHRLQHSIKVEGSARDRLDHVVSCRRPVIGPLQLTPESRDLLPKRAELTHVTDPCGCGVPAGSGPDRLSPETISSPAEC
jgi:hypothetical protein